MSAAWPSFASKVLGHLSWTSISYSFCYKFGSSFISVHTHRDSCQPMCGEAYCMESVPNIHKCIWTLERLSLSPFTRPWHFYIAWRPISPDCLYKHRHCSWMAWDRGFLSVQDQLCQAGDRLAKHWQFSKVKRRTWSPYTQHPSSPGFPARWAGTFQRWVWEPQSRCGQGEFSLSLVIHTCHHQHRCALG